MHKQKGGTPFWYNGEDDVGIKPVYLLSLKGCPYFFPFFSTCLLHPTSRICHLLLRCPCPVTHQNGWCLNSLTQQKSIRKTVHIWVCFLKLFLRLDKWVEALCCKIGLFMSEKGTYSWNWMEGETEARHSSFCSFELLDLFSPVLCNSHRMP